MSDPFRSIPADRAAPVEFAGSRVTLTASGDLVSCEEDWRALERRGLAVPYQRFDWVAAWFTHVAPRTGARPLVIVGRDLSDRPVFVWPFAVRREGMLRIARIPGDDHANFGGGLWTREVAAAGVDDVGRLVSCLPGCDADLLAFTHQPFALDGVAHPLRRLPHARAAVDVFATRLDHEYERLRQENVSKATRKKQRRKERLLAGDAELGHLRATTGDDVERIFAAFLDQKAGRLREIGAANPYEDPAVQAFIRAAALEGLATGNPAVELHALTHGSDIIATLGGASNGHRFSGMFNSITRDARAQLSPGELLVARVIEDCCRRGFSVFDLGIGEARYKRTFCKDIEPLFDCWIGLTPAGRLAAAAHRAAMLTKAQLRQIGPLVQVTRAVRSAFGSHTAQPPGASVERP